MGVVEEESSSGHFRLPPRPVGLRRLLLRLPIYLYRLRLGWLVGNRLLLLRHRGRKTGHTHSTVLEVIKYDAACEESFVVSAWGKKTDWYSNIKANPPIDVQIGWRRYVPMVHFLSPEDGYEVLTDYERRNPGVTRFLVRLVGVEYDGSEEARRRLASVFPVVSFRPNESGGVGPP